MEMRLVKNNRAVIGQNLAECVAAHIQIGEKKMMIYDDDVRRIGALAHFCNKTRLEIGTFLSETSVAFGVYSAPKAYVFRQIRQFGFIAKLRFSYPPPNFFEMIHFVQAIEDRLVFRLRDAVKTGVIRAAFL